MFNNENVIAEAESKPKIAGGAIAAWVVAGFIMLPAIWGALELGEFELIIGFAIFAAFPALIGLAIQLSLINGAKSTAIIATERCIYCKSKATQRYNYGGGLMELPYESIINIRVAPEDMSRVNGDMLTLYLPSGMLVFRNITNAPQIVMAIRSKVEEIKGPMPPYGYGVMMPMYGQSPMGYAPPYGQPMYGQPMQQQYGQPMYGQPMQQQYGQPVYGQPVQQQYGQPNYQPVQPNYVAPPQSPYQPVRPEYQQPMQNVYPNQPPAPDRTESAQPTAQAEQPNFAQPSDTSLPETSETAKPAENFDFPEDGGQPQ